MRNCRFNAARAILVALALAGMVAPACECSPRSTPERTKRIGNVVPSSARAALTTQRLDGFLLVLETLAHQKSSKSAINHTRERFKSNLKFDPYVAASWKAMGVSTDQKAHVFEDDAHWVLAARLEDPKALPRWVESHTKEHGFTSASASQGGYDVYRIGSSNDVALLYLASNDRTLFAVPVGSTQPSRPGTIEPQPLNLDLIQRRVQAWSRLEPQERLNETHAMKLVDAFDSDMPFYGIISPAKWMGNADPTLPRQAQTIYRRIQNQLGPIGIGAHFDPVARRIEARLKLSDDPEAPSFVPELSSATGALPDVGGLVTPGVLGAFRISVDPTEFFTLARSLLPAQMRLEVDAVIARYRDELAIDLMTEVLHTIHGHMVVAIYGFDVERLRSDNPTLVADIVGLRATREAVLIPIRSREPLEDVLNAATQLSRGKLNRQITGDSIQYAWIDDGLQWALVLTDEAIIVVDSTAAFDHAIAYERSARPLDEVLSQKGVDAVFAPSIQAGAYIDTGSLARLMADAGDAQLASWIEPFESIVMTDTDGDATLSIVIQE